MANEVSLVPQKWHDILVEAIGTKEHVGRVCGVGEDISLRLFFGTSRKTKELRKKKIDELVSKKLTHEREVQKK